MFEPIDKAAKYWPTLSRDPHFYDAKAYLRDRFPNARGIEVLPHDDGQAVVTVIDETGEANPVVI